MLIYVLPALYGQWTVCLGNHNELHNVFKVGFGGPEHTYRPLASLASKNYLFDLNKGHNL